MFNLSTLLLETSAPATTPQGGDWMYYLVTFGPLVLIVVLMYFIMIRPQRKKQKEEQKMRNNLRVGDEITTIGGIVGKIVMVKPDTIVIETSDDRVRMELTKWAVSTTGVQSSGEEKSSKEEKKEDEVKKTEEIPEAPAEETAPEAPAAE